MGRLGNARREAAREAERDQLAATLGLSGTKDATEMSLATLRLLGSFQTRIRQLELELNTLRSTQLNPGQI